MCSTSKEYAQTIMDVFAEFPYEAPFAAVYFCTNDGGGDRTSIRVRLRLAGSVGVAETSSMETHPLLPQTFTTTHHSGPSRRMGPLRAPSTIGGTSFTESESGGSQSSIPATIETSETSDESDQHEWASSVIGALRSQTAVVHGLPSEYVQYVGRDRGWHDRVRNALVIPIVVKANDLEPIILILGKRFNLVRLYRWGLQSDLVHLDRTQHPHSIQ